MRRNRVGDDRQMDHSAPLVRPCRGGSGSRGIAVILRAVILRAAILGSALVGWGEFLPAPVQAVPPLRVASDATAAQRWYTSRYCRLCTDLSPADARRLLTRLDRVAQIASRYWQRPLAQPIECYVVQDLSAWPAGTLPGPLVHSLLRHVGGGIWDTSPSSEHRTPRRVRVCARAEPGIAEHEFVHAYCMQVFGVRGPDWYGEGMAELANYRVAGEQGVQCAPDVIQFLRQSPPATVLEIVQRGAFTDPIRQSLERLVATRSGPEGSETGQDTPAPEWTPADEFLVRKSRDSYHASWALCHLLSQHPRYSTRFQRLGQALLNGQEVDFAEYFGPVMPELEFEMRQFIRHLAVGYRVDLCRWDWHVAFAPLAVGEIRDVRVRADRGYQATGITVKAGEVYQLQATGNWRTSATESTTTARGGPTGEGCLEAVVWQDYQLGASAGLGDSTRWVAPSAGQLHLRCRDRWHELADNKGILSVRVAHVVEPAVAVQQRPK